MSLTTLPISCAAWARLATSALVFCASLTASPTRSIAWLSCRLISPIDSVSSRAASEAAFTLTAASFEVRTAPDARCEVSREEADRPAAVPAHLGGAVAHGPQHRLDARAERADLGIDRGPMRLLLGERSDAHFGHAPLGDVVVGADPVIAAAGRAVDPPGRMPVRPVAHGTQRL